MKLDKFDNSWKNIWRNSKNALPEDKWKWDMATWYEVEEQIWEGDIANLVCPVCHASTVYFKFLVFSQHRVNGEDKMLADRWVGCESCGTQIRCTSLTPKWLKNPEWAPGVEKAHSMKGANQ